MRKCILSYGVRAPFGPFGSHIPSQCTERLHGKGKLPLKKEASGIAVKDINNWLASDAYQWVFTDGNGTGMEILKSEQQRDSAPDVTEADLTELVSGNSGFAFDLYQEVRQKAENLFYSPHSISLALAMTYAGARNNTESQMADTLHFSLTQEQLHPAFNALDLELASRGQGAEGQDGPFHLLGGSQITVPMMSQTGYFRYASGDGYQAVEMPYDGKELSMVVFLPEAGRFEEFEASLDAGRVEAIADSLSLSYLWLSVPRFKYEWGLELVDTLEAMGMKDAFNAAADFSGIDGTRALVISEVIHKAFVSVNEAGTEAAAATAVIFSFGAALSNPIELTLDHPFIFLIRDIETGAILFVGRVLNPGQ